MDRKALKARVIECVFEDWKVAAYKIISFHAKRARGLMARYAIPTGHHAAPVEGFDLEGFALDKQPPPPRRAPGIPAQARLMSSPPHLFRFEGPP